MKPNPAPIRILSDIVMLSATDGWAVGEDGTIFKVWRGSWQVFTSPVTTDLNAIQMLDSANGGSLVQAGRSCTGMEAIGKLIQVQ